VQNDEVIKYKTAIHCALMCSLHVGHIKTIVQMICNILYEFCPKYVQFVTCLCVVDSTLFSSYRSCLAVFP